MVTLLFTLFTFISCSKSEEVDLYSDYTHPDLLYSIEYPIDWEYFEEERDEDGEVYVVLFGEQNEVSVRILSYSPERLRSNEFFNTGYKVWEALRESLLKNDDVKLLEERDVFYGSLPAKHTTYKYLVHLTWWEKTFVEFVGEDFLYTIIYDKAVDSDDNDGYFDYMVNSFEMR